MAGRRLIPRKHGARPVAGVGDGGGALRGAGRLQAGDLLLQSSHAGRVVGGGAVPGRLQPAGIEVVGVPAGCSRGSSRRDAEQGQHRRRNGRCGGSAAGGPPGSRGTGSRRHGPGPAGATARGSAGYCPTHRPALPGRRGRPRRSGPGTPSAAAPALTLPAGGHAHRHVPAPAPPGQHPDRDRQDRQRRHGPPACARPHRTHRPDGPPPAPLQQPPPHRPAGQAAAQRAHRQPRHHCRPRRWCRHLLGHGWGTGRPRPPAPPAPPARPPAAGGYAARPSPRRSASQPTGGPPAAAPGPARRPRSARNRTRSAPTARRWHTRRTPAAAPPAAGRPAG